MKNLYKAGAYSCLRTLFSKTRNKTLLIAAGLAPLFLNAGAIAGVQAAAKKDKPSVLFIENRGQVTDQYLQPRPDVLFSGIAEGMVYHLRTSGISYQLYKKAAPDYHVYRLDVNWLGIRQGITVTQDAAVAGVDHFYNAASGPVMNVKTYTGVTYQHIYDKIDLHYYESKGALKYDYLLEPYADYTQIKLQVEGVQDIALQPNGSLVLKTPLGNIQEGAPLVYQAGKKINAKWHVQGHVLSFEIADYDHAQDLLIDPATRVWGTYYGAGTPQFLGTNGNGCTTDASGNVYFVGLTDASAGTGIATSGSHQATLSGGFGDGFLVKFNSLGVRQWGTYYGGPGGSSHFNNCMVDPATGDVYACGLSSSTSGIATPGAHQVSAVASGDAMLVKFNSAGVRQWGTYYGDSGTDEFYEMCIDGSGNVYVSGRTASSSGIATPGSHQPAFGGGTSPDAMLVKFNSAGVRQWGTYYGGSGDEYGYGLGIDGSANVYLSGEASSTSAISTPGSHQPAFGGGTMDGFLAKFNSAGVRQWGTYYGGLAIDYFNSCEVAANGDVFITGNTSSTSGIATPGSYQVAYAGGLGTQPYDAMLAKFDANGVRQWGTYFGGAGSDFGNYCTTDVFNNVIIAGYTGSSSGIATPGSHQTVFAGGSSSQPYDACLAKFNASGANLWGTYYGGASRDVASGCAVDAAGTKIYLSGSTETNGGNAIATPGAHQVSIAATDDGFLAQFSDCIAPNAPVNTTAANSLTLCSGSSANLSATASGSVYWFNSPSSTTTLSTGGSYSTGALAPGTHTFYAATSNTCSSSSRTAITLTVSPLITVNSGVICPGGSFTIVPGGVSAYTISGGNAVVSPASSTSYTVTGTDATGCTGSAISSITVGTLPTAIVNSGKVCAGTAFTIGATGATSYSYTNGAGTFSFTGNLAVVTPTASTAYTVLATGSAGCTNTLAAVSNVTVDPSPSVTTVSTRSVLCKGQVAVITASGAATYSWSTGATTATIAVNPAATANYTLTGTGANGCTNKVVVTQSVSACNGIADAGLNLISSIFPNPAGDYIHITLTQPVETGFIELYNALGQLVIQTKLTTSGDPVINLTQQAGGVYLVKVVSSHGQLLGSTKILKE